MVMKTAVPQKESCREPGTGVEPHQVSTIMVGRYLPLTLLFILITATSLYLVSRYSSGLLSLSFLSLYSKMFVLEIAGLLVIYFLLDTLRLFWILKTLNVDVSIRTILPLTFINIFVSNVTPFASGGGIVQMFFLNKCGVSLGNAAAATTIRTVLAIFFLFLSAPIIILTEKNLHAVLPVKHLFLVSVTVAGIYFLAFYFLIARTRFIKRAGYAFLLSLLKRHIISEPGFFRMRRRLIREINTFSMNCRSFFRGNAWYVFLSLLFTVLFLLSLFGFSVLLIENLDSHISVLSIITFQIVITFFMYFIPTPGATGMAEGGFAFMFAQFVPRSHLGALTFAWRFFTIYIGMIIGLVILTGKVVKIGFAKKA